MVSSQHVTQLITPSFYIHLFSWLFFTIPTTLLIIRSLLCWFLSVCLSPNIESPPQLFLLTFHYVLSNPNYFHDFNSMLKILKSLFSSHFATRSTCSKQLIITSTPPNCFFSVSCLRDGTIYQAAKARTSRVFLIQGPDPISH